MDRSLIYRNLIIGGCLLISGAVLLWHHIILRPDGRQWPQLGRTMRAILFGEGVVAITVGLKVVQGREWHSPSFEIVAIAVLIHVTSSLINEYLQRKVISIRRAAVRKLIASGAHVFSEERHYPHI